MSHPQSVEGWKDGKPFPLVVDEIECGKLLDARLVQQAQDALQAGRMAGLLISISSSWRTWDEQEELYRKWKAGVPGANPADPPGYSKHQEGVALDLHFNEGDSGREDFAVIALAHGFTRPVHREPWHFVLTDIDKTPPDGRPLPFQEGEV